MDNILDRLDKIQELSGLQKGLMIASTRVEVDAKYLCPVDDGTLRASINSRVEGDVGIVGTNVEYAIYQEFGTIKMGAQPFLFPALEMNRENIKKDIAQALKEDMQ